MKRLTVLLSALMLLSVSFGAMAIEPVYPAATKNSNLWWIYQKYQNMIEEIDRSLTKSTAGALSHDATRWRTYISEISNYVVYWQSQAYLDYPVTFGKDWTVGDPLSPDCDFKSNLSACELMALVANARDELVTSASANIPLHLYPADLTRQESYWSAMLGYIDFIESMGTIDEPVTAAEANLGMKPGDEPPAQ